MTNQKIYGQFLSFIDNNCHLPSYLYAQGYENLQGKLVQAVAQGAKRDA